MRILLTGAAGFTGHHFAKAASALGHTVMPLQANLTDRDSLVAEVAAMVPDAVVHLAGIAFVGHADDAAFYAVNVVGTTNLLAALQKLPIAPGCVLLASSANVYGNCIASPIVETQTPSPVNHYAASKLAMEYMALTHSAHLPIVIARPFNYTGPGQHINFVIPKLVEHFSRSAPSISLGNLNVEREFNSVQTVCSAYLALLAYGRPGEIYNVCSGKPHTLASVVGELSRISNHHMQVLVNPAFVRANELHRLCGDPGKLHRLLAANGVELKAHSLSDMLREMLEAAR